MAAGCRVERLEMEGSRVVGAIATRSDPDGHEVTVRIRADHVFVCAGPTESPSANAVANATVPEQFLVHPFEHRS